MTFSDVLTAAARKRISKNKSANLASGQDPKLSEHEPHPDDQGQKPRGAWSRFLAEFREGLQEQSVARERADIELTRKGKDIWMGPEAWVNAGPSRNLPLPLPQSLDVDTLTSDELHAAAALHYLTLDTMTTRQRELFFSEGVPDELNEPARSFLEKLITAHALGRSAIAPTARDTP